MSRRSGTIGTFRERWSDTSNDPTCGRTIQVMRIVSLLVVGAVACAACSSGDDDAEPAATTSASATDERATDTVDGTIGAIDTGVAVTPGAMSEGSLEVDGQTVDYVVVTPDGFSVGDTAPVLVAFPPGGQTIDLTRSTAEQTYLTEAVERGWVVFSPAAPTDGPLWFNESAALVPSILDWIETWVRPEGGDVHVAGISNGGLSTFAAATLVPDRVQSLVVFPGFARGDEARAGLADLSEVPVRMFVGGNDAAWIEPMQSTADTLAVLGGDATLEVIAGAGHIIGPLRDGVRIFDELDANRQTQ